MRTFTAEGARRWAWGGPLLLVCLGTSGCPSNQPDAGDPTVADAAADGSVADAGAETGVPDTGGIPADAATGHPGATPHPMLSTIGPGSARDLGQYRCADRVGGSQGIHCDNIHDYSRFNYDPYNHRLVFFGGGHSATSRTDVDAFDLSPESATSLLWSSDYPSMTCEQTESGDLAPEGYHRATGHPATRHTYDLNVIASTVGGPRLVVLGYEGFSGFCHTANAEIGSVASYDLAGSERWTYGPVLERRWYYADQAEFDPISGMVIVVGRGGMWVYDPNPGSEGIVAHVPAVAVTHYDGNLVFYPPTGEMYWFKRVFEDAGAPEVSRIALHRDDWSSSTITELVTTGDLPPSLPGSALTGYAYDSEFERIGGSIVGRNFYRFDPRTNEWTAQEIAPIAGESIPAVLNVVSHCLDYDPVNHVYLFQSGPPRARHTWAYRDTR